MWFSIIHDGVYSPKFLFVGFMDSPCCMSFLRSRLDLSTADTEVASFSSISVKMISKYCSTVIG